MTTRHQRGENPYQSPQEVSDAKPDSPDSSILYRTQPTWRFWILLALSAPLVGIFLVPLGAQLQQGTPPAEAIPSILITSGLTIALVASCILLALYWQSPARRKTHPGAGAQSGFVIAAIWLLALLAAPLAFVCTCTPVTMAAFATGGNEGSIILGILAGCGGLGFVGWLARGLWLDAAGRPRQPVDECATRETTLPPGDTSIDKHY